MDDIESSANPSWDDDYHRYANGLNNFLDPDGIVTDGAVKTEGKNKWSRDRSRPQEV